MENKYYNLTIEELKNAEKQGIDVMHKYGLDGQYIYFTPKEPIDIVSGDVIVQDKIQLRCVEPGTFAIWANSVDFVRGIYLTRNFKIL